MNVIPPIVPIQPIDSISSIAKIGAAQNPQSSSAVTLPFQSLFEDAVSNAQQTNTALDGEISKLATGRTDNMHDALIASEKASMSVNMVVELRNKLLDSYNQVMNINV